MSEARSQWPSHHTRQKLRRACRAGDLVAVTSALESLRSQGDQGTIELLLQPFEDDGGNSLLHDLCSGQRLPAIGRLLWALGGTSSSQQQPSQHDEARAALLHLLVDSVVGGQRLLLLATVRNTQQQTPLHACLASASTAVLAALLQQLAQLPAALAPAVPLLVSVADGAGRTPFQLAIQLGQWEAARLLAAAGGALLSHGQVLACKAAGEQLEGSGGWLAPAPSKRQDGDGLAAGAGGTSSLLGAVGNAAVSLWGALTAPLSSSGASHEALAALAGQGGGGGGSSGSGSDSRQQQEDELKCEAEAQLYVPVLRLSEAEAAAQQQDRLEAAAADAATAVGAPGGGGKDVEGAAQGTAHCLVCYEECSWQELRQPPGVVLGCGHATCADCWRGIVTAALDAGELHTMRCPQPDCGLPLPPSKAAALVQQRQQRRLQQLLAQAYVASGGGNGVAAGSSRPSGGDGIQDSSKVGGSTGGTSSAAGEPSGAAGATVAAAAPAGAVKDLRWCPHPGCVRVLQLVPGGDGKRARAVAAAGRGLDVRCDCGHAVCWACSEAAHEPATCEQMRRWRSELSALHITAREQDRRWLSRNTKPCPQCGAHIQKQGGCNHMRCGSCQAEFCWECARPWSQHGPATGGFYLCTLEQQRRVGQPGGGDDAEGQGSSSGGGSWIASVWQAVKNATAQHQLQPHMRQYLAHECSPAALEALAAHLAQLLVEVAGVSSSTATTSGGSRGESGSSAVAWDTAAAAPQLLGLSGDDLTRMSAREWQDVVAAAAGSLAEAWAGLEGSCDSGSGGGSGSSNSQGSSAVEYLPTLAETVAAAHRVVQHAAAAAYSLPPYSAPRRTLAVLVERIEGRLQRLEPLLLSLPQRQAALEFQEQQQQRKREALLAAGSSGVWRLWSSSRRCLHQHSFSNGCSSGAGSSSGGGGFLARLLHSWYGVRTSAASAGVEGGGGRPAVASVGAEVLEQQLQFAAAVHAQRRQVMAAVAELRRDLSRFLAGARQGLFAQ